MSFFSRIGDLASSAYEGVTSFFQSDTAQTIASGARDVLDVMKGGTASLENFKPQGLVSTRADFGSLRSRGTSRSKAGTPSFSDVGEATYYKYAQLQNTIRYLYGTKSRYKSIAKDR
jgi:hypothetical protein|tara:strand:+ start:254 stop:604 length:351 start_codon:yes stop_codon:yes gene_type:complete